MAEYDGEIRIKTLIENGEASSKLMQMESQFHWTFWKSMQREQRTAIFILRV